MSFFIVSEVFVFGVCFCCGLFVCDYILRTLKSLSDAVRVEEILKPKPKINQSLKSLIIAYFKTFILNVKTNGLGVLLLFSSTFALCLSIFLNILVQFFSASVSDFMDPTKREENAKSTEERIIFWRMQLHLLLIVIVILVPGWICGSFTAFSQQQSITTQTIFHKFLIKINKLQINGKKWMYLPNSYANSLNSLNSFIPSKAIFSAFFGISGSLCSFLVFWVGTALFFAIDLRHAWEEIILPFPTSSSSTSPVFSFFGEYLDLLVLKSSLVGTCIISILNGFASSEFLFFYLFDKESPTTELFRKLISLVGNKLFPDKEKEKELRLLTDRKKFENLNENNLNFNKYVTTSSFNDEISPVSPNTSNFDEENDTKSSILWSERINSPSYSSSFQRNSKVMSKVSVNEPTLKAPNSDKNSKRDHEKKDYLAKRLEYYEEQILQKKKKWIPLAIQLESLATEERAQNEAENSEILDFLSFDSIFSLKNWINFIKNNVLIPILFGEKKSSQRIKIEEQMREIEDQTKKLVEGFLELKKEQNLLLEKEKTQFAKNNEIFSEKFSQNFSITSIFEKIMNFKRTTIDPATGIFLIIFCVQSLIRSALCVIGIIDCRRGPLPNRGDKNFARISSQNSAAQGQGISALIYLILNIILKPFLISSSYSQKNLENDNFKLIQVQNLVHFLSEWISFAIITGMIISCIMNFSQMFFSVLLTILRKRSASIASETLFSLDDFDIDSLAATEKEKFQFFQQSNANSNSQKNNNSANNSEEFDRNSDAMSLNQENLANSQNSQKHFLGIQGLILPLWIVIIMGFYLVAFLFVLRTNFSLKQQNIISKLFFVKDEYFLRFSEMRDYYNEAVFLVSTFLCLGIALAHRRLQMYLHDE